MAKRYIDADTLTERLRLQYCKECDNYNGVRCGSCDIDFVFDMVEDAPTADVVEVCRCEDCIHWQYTGEGLTNIRVGICSNIDNDGFSLMRETDFCSYGERRANNDDE